MVTKKLIFYRSQLEGSFCWFIFTFFYVPSMAEPRMPQTQKCLKHRVLKCSIKKNIGAQKDDREKMYKK